MTFNESFLYSRGVYWLFEHWQEDGKNIYSKSKYANLDDFTKGAGKFLTLMDIEKLKKGNSITLDQEDGTKFFFKFVNLP